MLGGTGGCTLAREDRHDDVAVGDASLQRLSAGIRNGGDAIFRHARENLHELAVAIGVSLKLGRTDDKGAGKSQSLNGAPLRRAPGLRISTGK